MYNALLKGLSFTPGAGWGYASLSSLLGDARVGDTILDPFGDDPEDLPFCTWHWIWPPSGACTQFTVCSLALRNSVEYTIARLRRSTSRRPVQRKHSTNHRSLPPHVSNHRFEVLIQAYTVGLMRGTLVLV